MTREQTYKIKPLEWTYDGDGICANSPVASYSISFYDGCYNAIVLSDNGDQHWPFAYETEAKESCERDYRSRLLSALEPVEKEEKP